MENKKFGTDKSILGGYIGLTAGVFLFSVIYELNSHQVYSKNMMLAFCIPLIGGVIVSVIVMLTKMRKRIPIGSVCFYRAALLSLLVGTVWKGAFDIYGTVVSKVSYFFYAAAVFAVAALVFLIKSAVAFKHSDY